MKQFLEGEHSGWTSISAAETRDDYSSEKNTVKRHDHEETMKVSVCRSCTRPKWVLKYIELAVRTDDVYSTLHASDREMCTAGNYRNKIDNKCYPCPVGQYQPQDLQDKCLPCYSSYSTISTGTVNASGCISSHLVLPEAFTDVVVGALLVVALAVCCYCARRYIVKRKRRREERRGDERRRGQADYPVQTREPRPDKPGQARSHNARGMTSRHTRQQKTSRERSKRGHDKGRHLSPPSQRHPDDRDWRPPPSACRRPTTSWEANQTAPSVVSHDYCTFTSAPSTDEHVYEHIYETIPL
ncbi:uncharacterized protein [Haliotis asinina]|uniref:uncharacterized protein n=1 Tax=Haliotis asinina TaxID=109174 RepID=UPI003531F4A5